MAEGPLKSHKFTLRLDTFDYHALKELADELYKGKLGYAAREVIRRGLEEYDGDTDLRRIAIALETIAKSRRN